VPLPTQLAGVSVRVNGVLAPLLFVGVGGGFGAGGCQINYQLPYETPPGVAFVEVLHNGTPLMSEFLAVSEAAPGVFTTSASGSGQAVAQTVELIALPPNGDPNQVPGARPVDRGGVIVIYANGQGGQFINPATRQPLAIASGAAAPASGNPLYATAATPLVTIGGVPAAVEFSGLTPGLVGLWQLNVRVPGNAPTGNKVELAVTSGGRTSKVTEIAVR
jgi:uncharacterized protein (TIGR03437 family)